MPTQFDKFFDGFVSKNSDRTSTPAIAVPPETPKAPAGSTGRWVPGGAKFGFQCADCSDTFPAGSALHWTATGIYGGVPIRRCADCGLDAMNGATPRPVAEAARATEPTTTLSVPRFQRSPTTGLHQRETEHALVVATQLIEALRERVALLEAALTKATATHEF